MKAAIKKNGSFSSEIEVPGDKSISHRALIFGAAARGDTFVRNFLNAEDCRSTMLALKAAGTSIIEKEGCLSVSGRAGSFAEPDDVIDCGNSGTTMRLLSGVFASQPFYTVLTGDGSLRQRPMNRIIEPLRMMGAEIDAREGGMYPPVTIKGGKLAGIDYTMPVASAQVKSCIILAAILSGGKTVINEPVASRDHTERMLAYLGGNIRKRGSRIIIGGKQELRGKEVVVPGDFSSAAYFMAAPLMTGNSRIMVKNVGLNPTRTGFIDVIKRMGADVRISGVKELSGEPAGDVEVRSGPLHGTEISPREVPVIIDEIPLIAVLASVSSGTTSISGAGELKVKESDRLNAIACELGKMEAAISATEDGLVIEGRESLKSAMLDSWNDHRIAMSLSVAALKAEGSSEIANFECVNISFPSFARLFQNVGAGITFS